MHSLVMVGGVLRAPWHGVLGVLSLRVLCQVAGCIRNVVHATFTHEIHGHATLQVKATAAWSQLPMR